MAFRPLSTSRNFVLVCLLLAGLGCSSSEPQGSDLPGDTAADNRDVVQLDSDPGTDDLIAELTGSDADAFLFDEFEAVQDSDSGSDAQHDALDGVTPDADAAHNDVLDSVDEPCPIEGRALYNNLTEHDGIEIRLCRGNSTSPDEGIVAVTHTDIDGKYSFEGVLYAHYEVYALNEGFSYKEYDDETVYCDSEYYNPVRDMYLTAAAKIVGHASYPLEAARPDNSGIKVFSRDRAMSATTDGNGYFEFVASAGHYEICAADADFVGICSDAVDVVDLLVEYEVTPLNLGVYDVDNPVSGCLSGVITLTGVDNSSGISVSADCSGNIVETTTDESGAYTLEGLTPGQCALTFSAPEGSGFEQNADFDVNDVFSGVCISLPRLYLGRGRNLGSHLTHDDGSIGAWVSFSNNSRYVVFLDSGHRLISFDTVTGQQVVLSENARHFVISPDSSLVGYYQYDSTMETGLSIDVVSIAGGEPKEFLFQDGYTGNFAFSPDSRYFACSYIDGTVTVRDLRSDESKKFCSGRPASLKFSPDSRLLLCRKDSGYLSVNDVENGLTLFEQSDVSSYVFSLDWSRMVTCRSGGFLDSFNTVSGLADSFSDETSSCDKTFTMSPSGDSVAYIKDAHFLYSANLEDGSPVLLQEAEIINLLSVTPDSTRIVYATRPGTEYSDTWTVMQGYLESGIAEQVFSPIYEAGGIVPGQTLDPLNRSIDVTYGYMIGKDSDVLFFADKYAIPAGYGYFVLSISLDGSADGWGDLYIFDFMKFDPYWRINEDVGVGISSGRYSVQYLFHGNSWGDLPFWGGLLTVADDNLSFISTDTFPGNRVWVWLKDGAWSSIPLFPDLFSVPQVAYFSVDVNEYISPDSNWLLYRTFFAPAEAFSVTGNLYSYQSRLNLVDLREIRGQ